MWINQYMLLIAMIMIYVSIVSHHGLYFNPCLYQVNYTVL